MRNVNSHLLPQYFSYRSSGENLLEYQASTSSLIMFIILMATLFNIVLILQGENFWTDMNISHSREKLLKCNLQNAFPKQEVNAWDT